MSFTSIRTLDLKGRTVLLRADLNVPAKDGKVTDTTRIDRLKPTIDLLTKAGAKTLVLSHFGRPKAREAEFSLKFLLPSLKSSWGVDVAFADDCIGAPAQALASQLQNGQVGLLENVRFYKEEEANDSAFAAKLAALGDLYVNDAFSAAHRAHASTEGLAHILPAAAGLLMEAELSALNAALENPVRPVVAIVGGAKISTKLDLLNNLVRKTDSLILGGGMANTFLAAKGVDVKKSLCESDMLDQARTIMQTAEKAGCKIVLPVDVVVAEKFEANAPNKTVPAAQVPDGQMILDVGPDSVAACRDVLQSAKTLVWNGPLGVFEMTPFDAGTNGLAKAVAELTRQGKLVSVAGGGDTVAALEHAGIVDDMTYVSTAGGAFLEWMEGKVLPGVAALTSGKKAAA